jgi:membrane protease YdiL (CAAX protease family)
MADKAVTLVTVASQSGEAEKVPSGRRWAAQLGMLTFSIGVLTQQWQLAVIGIVYSYITSAAMWQNFRARLPYLYDPWSEELPPAPTLMHAMISISVLIEVSAVVSGSLIGIAGKDYAAIAQAVGYAISALIVSAGVWKFLDDRDVTLRDVVRWPSASARGGVAAVAVNGSFGRCALFLLAGAGVGVVLGVVAHGYMAVLRHIPEAAEILRKSEEQLSSVPDLRMSLTVMAVAFAPFAEEYLFRGLLYRALDREWGGWKAVAGSAAFFAIYHPPLSWLPVAALGAASAILFKKTGRLAPCVVLHAVYNAVVSLS